MKPLHMALISALILSSAALSAPGFAQEKATKPTLNLGMDQTSGPLYGQQATDPAADTPYMPQSDTIESSPAQSTALDQVNLGTLPASDPQNTTSPQ